MFKKIEGKSYIVWDLETSGLSPYNDKILEIGWMQVDKEGNVQSGSCILDHGIDIDEKVSSIHGITKEKCDNEGLDPKSSLLDLVSKIFDNDIMVTHNGSRFDIPFLIQSLRSFGILREKDILLHSENNHIDTAAFFKAWRLGEKKFENEKWCDFYSRVLSQRVYGLKYNVSHCCDEFCIDKSDVRQHSAGGDIILTNKIFQKIKELDYVFTK